jgi:hypothetical protein
MPTKIDPATGREIDIATGKPIVNTPFRPEAAQPVRIRVIKEDGSCVELDAAEGEKLIASGKARNQAG